MFLQILYYFAGIQFVLVASKLKQSDRRAVGLVPFPRVGRSPTYFPAMMIMKVPRVGRSFMPKGYMVPETKLEADIMFESNHGLPKQKMGIEYQGMNTTCFPKI